MGDADVEKLGTLIQEGDVNGVRSFLMTNHPANRGFQHYDFAERTREYDTFATLAVKAQSLPIVEILMEHKYDFVESDVSDDSPLHLAVKQSNLDIVNAIVRYAIEQKDMRILDTQDYHKNTPLILAARNGDIDTVRLLISAGADKSIAAHGQTAFEVAKQNGFTAIASLLQQA